MLFKVFIVFVMAGIVFFLIRAGLGLVNGKAKDGQTLMSLKVRIALSVALFILIFLAFALGYIQPHGL